MVWWVSIRVQSERLLIFFFSFALFYLFRLMSCGFFAGRGLFAAQPTRKCTKKPNEKQFGFVLHISVFLFSNYSNVHTMNFDRNGNTCSIEYRPSCIVHIQRSDVCAYIHFTSQVHTRAHTHNRYHYGIQNWMKNHVLTWLLAAHKNATHHHCAVRCLLYFFDILFFILFWPFGHLVEQWILYAHWGSPRHDHE